MCIQSDYFDPRTFMPVGQQCDAHNKGQRGAAMLKLLKCSIILLSDELVKMTKLFTQLKC